MFRMACRSILWLKVLNLFKVPAAVRYIMVMRHLKQWEQLYLPLRFWLQTRRYFWASGDLATRLVTFSRRWYSVPSWWNVRASVDQYLSRSGWVPYGKSWSWRTAEEI